jgi:hypothetical protein
VGAADEPAVEPSRRSQRLAFGRSVVLGVALCVAAAPAVPVHTHHSLAGVYDSSASATIEGVVSEFQFINPHPFIIVGVRNAREATEDWRLELDNRFELEAIGVTSRTFRRGDRIVASGSPGRTQRTSLYVRRLDRPSDGFWYEQVGSTPRIR